MRIYLVSITKLAGGMEAFLRERGVEWLTTDASDAERTVEAAGRVCYMSFGPRQHRRTNADYISNLIAQGHDSVLEHANFTMLVDGISRALTHQLVRHRIGFAYSQLSQQYHDESHAQFVEITPPIVDPKLRKRWKNLMQQSRMLYRDLIGSGADFTAQRGLSPKERQRLHRSAARLVLPNATASTLMVTGNARAWRHLLAVRGNIKGDVEMRNYCVEIFKSLSDAAPNLFADFTLARDALGRYVTVKAKSSSRRVARSKRLTPQKISKARKQPKR